MRHLPLLAVLVAAPALAADPYVYNIPEQSKTAATPQQATGMTDSEIKAALTKAESGIEEMRRLAGEAVHALGEKNAGSDGSKSVTEGLYKKYLAECKSTFKGRLDPASITINQEEQIGSLACRAAASKSLALCDGLAATADSKETNPRERCKDLARMQMMTAALVTGSGPSVCSQAADVFIDFPAATRAGICKGVASGDCDAAAAASGGALGEKKKGICRNWVALRGAKSAAACAALSRGQKTACEWHFRSLKDPTCPPDGGRAGDEACAERATERVKSMQAEILANAKKSAAAGPGTVAMENYKKKREEVDGLLGRVDVVLRAAPAGGDRASVGRLKKLRQASAEVEKEFKTAVGAGQGKNEGPKSQGGGQQQGR